MLRRLPRTWNCIRYTTSYTFLHGSTHRVGTISILPRGLDRGVALRCGPRPGYCSAYGGAPCRSARAGAANAPVHAIAGRSAAVGVSVIAPTLCRSDEQ